MIGKLRTPASVIGLVGLLLIISGCTIMQHKYGEGSVIIMLGDQAYKVDARNDIETAIKDLIPEGILSEPGFRSATPVCYPQIEINYNSPTVSYTHLTLPTIYSV